MPAPFLPALITGLMALVSDRAEMRALERRPGTAGLTDSQLWFKVQHGHSPLAGMSWRDALIHDPRRIDGMMYQAVFRAIDSLIPLPPQALELNRALYLQAMDLARSVHGSPVPVEVLLSLARDNWGLSLYALEQAPSQAKRYLADNTAQLRSGFVEAADIAMRASADMRGVDPEQGRLWRELADVYAESWDAYAVVITGRALGAPLILLEGE